MRSVVLAALLLAACGTSPAVPVAKPDPVKVDGLAIARAFTYRVQIDCGKGEEPKPGGSAVNVGNGGFVTARHVVEGDEDCVFLLDRGGKPAVATWTKKDPDHDIALLYSPEFEMAQSAGAEMCEPVMGQELVTVGYPRGPNDRIQRESVTTGVVSSFGWPDDEVRITAPIYFGNSGGGAFDHASGCFVGTTVSGFMAMDGWYFIVPSQLAAALL